MVPDVDSGPIPSSSPPVSPPPRKSSLNTLMPEERPMPEDVYFTAAGRRESRMYISPYAVPDQVPLAPLRRGHSYSSSEPVFPVKLDGSSTSGTWAGSKIRRDSSGRPFEDATALGPISLPDEDSTPVLRKEKSWSGKWNRDDIQDVIHELRLLK